MGHTSDLVPESPISRNSYKKSRDMVTDKPVPPQPNVLKNETCENAKNDGWAVCPSKNYYKSKTPNRLQKRVENANELI